jgi:hypothetical protein
MFILYAAVNARSNGGVWGSLAYRWLEHIKVSLESASKDMFGVFRSIYSIIL